VVWCGVMSICLMSYCERILYNAPKEIMKMKTINQYDRELKEGSRQYEKGHSLKRKGKGAEGK
jgi:hypothetical protein